jgi:hypothetical protein
VCFSACCPQAASSIEECQLLKQRFKPGQPVQVRGSSSF